MYSPLQDGSRYLTSLKVCKNAVTYCLQLPLGQQDYFQSGGGIVEVENCTLALVVALAQCRGCLMEDVPPQKLEIFKKCGLQ